MKLLKSDIIKQGCDTELYRKILRKRKELGLDIHTSESTKILNHPFIGKEILNKKGKSFKKPIFVQDVYKHWYGGYYEMILYYSITDKGDRSHGNLFWRNINCTDETMKKIIKQNRNNYKIN